MNGMAKVLVTYQQPTDQEGFERHYHNVHIPLVQKLPYLKGAEIHRVLQAQNTSENYYLFAELLFDNPAFLSESLASPEGQEVQGDVLNLLPYLSKPPVILIVE